MSIETSYLLRETTQHHDVVLTPRRSGRPMQGEILNQDIETVTLNTDQYNALVTLCNAAMVVIEHARNKQQYRAEQWQSTVITILDKPVRVYEKLMRDL